MFFWGRFAPEAVRQMLVFRLLEAEIRLSIWPWRGVLLYTSGRRKASHEIWPSKRGRFYPFLSKWSWFLP